MKNKLKTEVVVPHSPAPVLNIKLQQYAPRKWSERYVSMYVAWPEGRPDLAAEGEGAEETIGRLMRKLTKTDYFGDITISDGNFNDGLRTRFRTLYEKVEDETS